LTAGHCRVRPDVRRAVLTQAPDLRITRRSKVPIAGIDRDGNARHAVPPAAPRKRHARASGRGALEAGGTSRQVRRRYVETPRTQERVAAFSVSRCGSTEKSLRRW
jgi:hypothetical protein